MRVRPAISAVAATAAFCAAPVSAPPQADFPDDATIQRLVRSDRAFDSVTVVFGLLEADGTRRIITVGHAPYDGHALFEIGSITKVFTGILLGEMAQRGELQLTDPVADLLPDTVTVPSRSGRPIRLIDLTTHTSGLPRMPSNFGGTGHMNPYAAYGADRLYAFLNTHELARDPGARFEYSNLGVGLLGHALALRADTTYEALLTMRVLEPLGLTSTFVTLPDTLQARFVEGRNARGFRVSWQNWERSALSGAGAVRASVHDLLTFLDANLSPPDGPLGRAIRQSHRGHFAASDRHRIGLGWAIYTVFDRTIITHGGATAGYRSSIGFDAERRTGVVAVTNSTAEVNPLALHLLEPRIPLVSSRNAIAFLLLVLAVATLVVVATTIAWRRTSRRKKWLPGFIAAAVAGSWLVATAVVGVRVLSADEPLGRLALIIAAAALAVGIGTARVGARLASGLPLAALVAAHTFRLPLELIMHRTYTFSVRPLPLGASGYTVETIIGLAAALLTLLVAYGRVGARTVLAWNWVGLALLLHFVVLALLNPWAGSTLFIWIPAFLLPFALLAHILVLRQLRARALAAAPHATQGTDH